MNIPFTNIRIGRVKLQATTDKVNRVKIQATEGDQSEVIIESLMQETNADNDGCTNNYKTYGTQTTAIFKKYRGGASLGNWQTRAVVDTRTAFISGEGMSVSAENEELAKWINKFLKFNKLTGSKFFDYVKAGEMTGKGLFTLHVDKKNNMIRVDRIPTDHEGGKKYTYTPKDLANPTGDADIKVEDKPFKEKNYVFAKLGGLPCDYKDTTTKTGLVLTQIDNYDRGMNAMRKNNHIFGRPTPFFECQDDGAVKKIALLISNKMWKIGVGLAARAKMHMVVPDVGTMENIKLELGTNAKAISSTTAIPVHWLGHVDMMSNRSTADSLYETINNGTVNERTIWAETFYDLIFKAQTLAVDNGLKDAPKTVNPDYTVDIPLIPFTKMLDYIKALSLAFNDGAISMTTYENKLPGIDPYEERKNKKKEAAATIDATQDLIKKTNITPPEGEEINNGKE